MKPRRLSPLKRISHVLETVAAYIVYGFFRLLPLETASALGGSIMRKVGPRMGITRTALSNLDVAFPEKTAVEKQAIMRGMWENLGRVVAEYPHLSRIKDNVEIEGAEHLDTRLEKGGPAIFFAGHLANWEVLAVAARNMGLPIYVVYRKPNNAGVDGLLRHARNAGAAGHIEKGKEGARDIMAHLRKGDAIGMLIDQKQSEGISMPFFGREAMTSDALARFGLKFGCKLFPVRVVRTKGAKFRVTVYPPLETVQTDDRDGDVRRLTIESNSLLEDWIREKPEEWLWIHNRWPSKAA